MLPLFYRNFQFMDKLAKMASMIANSSLRKDTPTSAKVALYGLDNLNISVVRQKSLRSPIRPTALSFDGSI